MNIETFRVNDLNPYGDNPRVARAGSDERLTQSIKRFGLFKPLLVWSGDDGPEGTTVIGGNRRLAMLNALAEDGKLPHEVELENGATVVLTEDVPCVRFPGSWREARVIAMRDNNHDGDWDYDAVAREMTELSEDDDFDLGLAGFDEGLLQDLVNMAATFDPGEFQFEEEVVPEPPAAEPAPDDDDPPPGETRQLARFVCGGLRGNIPVETYNRMLEAFRILGESMGTSDVPKLLSALLDKAGVA